MSIITMSAAVLSCILSSQSTGKPTQADEVRETPIVFADHPGIVAQADSRLEGVAVLAIIGLIGAALVIGALRASRREKQLAKLANTLGFKFIPERDKTRMGYRFDHIHQFGKHKGSASNHLIG